MTPAQLQAKLDELRALPGETEWVEFKHAERNYDFDDLGKYFSALSNEANLKGQPCGWLGFGIKDKTHEIVGTQFRPHRPQLDSLKQEVSVHTTHRLTFEEIHELTTPQGRVILFRIPAASAGSPTSWKGHFYGRNGESLVALSLHEIEQIRGQCRAFEPGIALAGIDGDGVVDLLDTEAYFRLTKQRLPANRAAVLARLADEHLIVAAGASNFDVTNLGAILFARDLTRFGRLGRKTLRVIKYRGTGRIDTEREWHDPPSRMGYAAGFEAAIAFINSQLPQSEHIGEALREEVRAYPEVAIRELVANTLIHQDFSVTGAGPMAEIFEGRIEITNPGEPLVDPQRFIDTPPQSRNETLAGFMRRLELCEERGSGIDKVITAIELYQMPPPDFRVPPGFTRTFLYAPRGLAEMDRSERRRACYQHCVLRYVSGTFMTNPSLRKRFGIDEKNAAKASRLIKDAVEAGLMRLFDPEARDRDRKYVPSWA